MTATEILKTDVGSNTRRHHYISASYLKNFASPTARNGKLYSLDKENKKQFPTSPNDSACERDFNRLADIDGVHPNFLEDALGRTIENDFSKVIEYVSKHKKLPRPKSEYYNVLITVIALFAVRNPSMRRKMEDFHVGGMDRIAELLVSKKEIWESHVRRMKEDGQELPEVKYEVVKKFVQNHEYKIVSPTGYHVPNELKMQQTVFPLIYNRRWELLISEDEKFISSNRPVSLVATTKELANMPLGFGLKSTAIIFPLSCTLCLAGTFEGKNKVRKLDKIETAEINGFTALSESRFIYSTHETFSFLTIDGVKTNSDLL